MMMDRRSFLKLSGASMGALLLDFGGRLPASAGTAAVPVAEEGTERLAMLYDNSLCVGCRACQMACKQWNKLPSLSTDPQGLYESPRDLAPTAWTLIQLARYQVNAQRDYLFFKKGCMHCGEPACVAVCPTSALKKQPNGLVTVEQDLCNGCGYCTQSCPFHVPQLQVNSGLTGNAKASKCTFCQDRVSQGLRPYCIQSCPVGALDWGGREEMLVKASDRVEVLKAGIFPEANLYGEAQLGGLGRLYVLLAPPTAYGLPQDPGFPASAVLLKKILQPVGQVAFGATILGLLAAFLVARHNVHMEEVE
jgi:formate dehydrogenase iron-sulfur subunit